jgi:hypothetical protein
MSQIPVIEETPVVSARASEPRTWAGTKVKAGQIRTTHYLHLLAYPCDQCNGPVIVGWIGRREDDITKETEINGIGATCLLCGARPDALQDSSAARHFRPVEWRSMTDQQAGTSELHTDPLSAERSQHAGAD